MNKDARVGIAFGTGQRSAAHRGVNMDVAVGDKFRALADDAGDDEVAVFSVNLLAGTHGRADQYGWIVDNGGLYVLRLRCLAGGRCCLCVGCLGGVALFEDQVVTRRRCRPCVAGVVQP